MEWLKENWLLVIMLIACPAMHLFCLRGHGNHGAHEDEKDAREKNKQP